jgi:uncharacterized protein
MSPFLPGSLMAKISRPAVALAALCLLTVAMLAAPLSGLRAQEIPGPTGYVNDFAGVFDAETAAALEDALRLAEEETSAEIVAVTVPDLGGTTIEDYAVRLFEQWGIGKSEDDNGVLLIMALEEREVRIEVGYGLEGAITDGRAGRILDEAVLPEFRDGNYALGMLNGLYEIRQAIENSDVAAPSSDTGSSDIATQVIDFIADHYWALLVFGPITIYMFGYMARTRSIALGAIWGAVVGWFAGWAIGGVLGGVVGVIAGAVLGLVLDAVLSTAYRGQVMSGGSTSWLGTRGGFGGLGTGRSGGTRFGGFGGGRSGGGGASRKF